MWAGNTESTHIQCCSLLVMQSQPTYIGNAAHRVQGCDDEARHRLQCPRYLPEISQAFELIRDELVTSLIFTVMSWLNGTHWHSQM